MCLIFTYSGDLSIAQLSICLLLPLSTILLVLVTDPTAGVAAADVNKFKVVPHAPGEVGEFVYLQVDSLKIPQEFIVYLVLLRRVLDL